MPRTLSADLRRALYSRESNEPLIQLLTIHVDSLPDPIRVCDDAVDVTSGGFTFLHFPFELVLPPEIEGAPPRASLRIAAADLTLIEAIRSVQGAIELELCVVRAKAPDDVEIGPVPMVLRNVEYDAGFVTGDLTIDDDFLNEPFPEGVVSPGRFPALGRVT